MDRERHGKAFLDGQRLTGVFPKAVELVFYVLDHLK